MQPRKRKITKIHVFLRVFVTSWLVVVVHAQSQPSPPGSTHYRTLNDRFAPPEFTSLNDWQRRAAYLREHILASAGLLPLPARTPLNARVFGEQRHDDYSVFKVYFESLPGFYVTGNLYRPAGTGPYPTVLSPHGHWPYGRLENTETASIPGRAISLARQGFVVFSYDMIGYNDSRQLTHSFGGMRESLWGLSLAGLQLWNSIRSLDFLESLPEVDRQRIGCSGASGGGTQTFLLAAVDDRIRVAAPVNMISLHMQGGCLCENPPGLRLDTTNVELAATIAPRPLLMVSATGDWTGETLEVEYPAIQRIFALFGATDRVHATRVDAPHNDNRESREAVYRWMARWLQHAPADVSIAERPFQPDGISDQLVFFRQPLPEGAVSAEQLVDQWIGSARQQIRESSLEVRKSTLLHALAMESSSQGRDRGASVPASTLPRSGRQVVLDGDDPGLREALIRAGFSVRSVDVTPYDANAAVKIAHFATYNRTQASQRVADIVRALNDAPGATLIAAGDGGLPALLALAVVSVDRAIVDVGQFDNSGDAAFLERLYIPGIRRAGDLQTAARLAKESTIIHNAGDQFRLEGPRIERRKLTTREIVDLIRSK
jgi:hypothetical protein